MFTTYDFIQAIFFNLKLSPLLLDFRQFALSSNLTISWSYCSSLEVLINQGCLVIVGVDCPWHQGLELLNLLSSTLHPSVTVPKFLTFFWSFHPHPLMLWLSRHLLTF